MDFAWGKQGWLFGFALQGCLYITPIHNLSLPLSYQYNLFNLKQRFILPLTHITTNQQMRKNDNPKLLHEKVGWELPLNLWTCRAYGHHGNQHRPWAPPWNTQLFRCLGALLLRTWSFHLISCARRSSTSGPTTSGIYHSMMTLLLQNKAEKKTPRQGQCGGNSAMTSVKALKEPFKCKQDYAAGYEAQRVLLTVRHDNVRLAIADSQTMAEAMQQWAKTLARKTKGVDSCGLLQFYPFCPWCHSL